MPHILFGFFLAAVLCLPLAAQPDYYPFAIDQDRLGGAADFGFLNRTLTGADKIVVVGDAFHTLGADGRPNTADDRPVRFFGVNLAFGGNFPEEKDAVRVAKRLRRLGVNLVRLHHMDTSPDNPADNRARSILTTGPYPTLNPVSVARLKKLLAAFAEEGIYVNLNLKVGYVFRPEVDKIPALPDGQPIPTQSKPLQIFHPRMVELQTEFVRRVMEALALRDNPVLAMVEINNESSLLYSWQRNQFGQTVLGEYKNELTRQWNAFLRIKYGSTAAVAKAWEGVLEGAQRVEDGTVEMVDSKETDPQARINDFLLFLVDRDRAYLKTMRDAARAQVSWSVPVTGTQMGFGGPLTYDSHQDLDYIDEHFYIDHYNFPNRRWDNRDWRIRDSSSVGAGLRTFLQVAAVRRGGQPYTVSEYNQQWPNTKGAELNPTLAAFGAFQDWNGLMHFAYQHSQGWDTPTPDGFNLNSDLSKLPSFGQSAWLFRSGVIQPGRSVIDASFGMDARLAAGRSKRIREVPEMIEQQHGVPPQQLFQHRVRLNVSGKGTVPAAARQPVSGVWRTDTGQLSYDPARKLFLLHADRAVGVFGFLEQTPAAAGGLEVELAPGARGFATILLTSLDNKPMADSARLLLSIPGDTMRSIEGSTPPRPQKLVRYPGTEDWWTLERDPSDPERPSGARSGGAPPVWMERVECTLELKTKAAQLTVYPLNGQGARMNALPEAHVKKVPGGYRIHLQAEGQDFAPWYEIAGPAR